MKNKIILNAIAAHSDANRATANGRTNITDIVTTIQIMTQLRSSIASISGEQRTKALLVELIIHFYALRRIVFKKQ